MTNIYHRELVCSRDDCSYECAVGNVVFSAFQRATPDECPMCGSELTNPDE